MINAIDLILFIQCHLSQKFRGSYITKFEPTALILSGSFMTQLSVLIAD
jgi:hypothetical protein